MSYSRAKRISTEFQNPRRKYFSYDTDPSSRQTPHLSNSSNGRTSVLSRVLKGINQQINYELLTMDQIVEQRDLLKKKIKQMNSKMARMAQKQMERRNQNVRVHQQSIQVREMGMSYEQLNKEYIENINRIEQMQDEFKESNDRLKLLSDPYSKMNLIHSIAQTELKVKQIKEQLSRIKKNKSIREREIIKGVKIDKGGQIQKMQVEYINYKRKTEQLMNRSEQIQTQLTDAQLKLMKQKDQYDELRMEIANYQEKQQLTPTMKEHYSILYKSHKKKLELYMKRNERQQEGIKRKYYALLLDFKNIKNRVTSIDHTISLRQQDNEQIYSYIKGLTDKLKQMQEQPGTVHNGNTTFMLTQIPKEKIFIKRRINTEAVQLPEEPIRYQRVINSPKQSRARKWNIRNVGSIIRQHSASKQMNYSFSAKSNSLCEQQSDYHSLHKNSKNPSTVKHFHTEGDDNSTPHLSQVTSDMEESYPSDFEG